MTNNGEIAYCFGIQVKQNNFKKKIQYPKKNILMGYWPNFKWIHAIL
jgi:hypothetical protein